MSNLKPGNLPNLLKVMPWEAQKSLSSQCLWSGFGNVLFSAALVWLSRLPQPDQVMAPKRTTGPPALRVSFLREIKPSPEKATLGLMVWNRLRGLGRRGWVLVAWEGFTAKLRLDMVPVG